MKAKNDAHVALGDSVDHDAGHWEIVLGGWGNSNSVIRDRNQGGPLVQHRGGVVYKDEARVFWIEWDAGHVRVGRGDEAEAARLLNYCKTLCDNCRQILEAKSLPYGDIIGSLSLPVCKPPIDSAQHRHLLIGVKFAI